MGWPRLERWWGLAILIAVWQIAAGVSRTVLLPPPSRVLAAWGQMLVSQELLRDCLASVLRVSCGFALAAVLGVGLGAVLGIVPAVAKHLRVVLELLRPIPPIAWIPLAVLWFGAGNGGAVFIVTLGAFFPIFVSTCDGISLVPRSYIDIARCFGAGRRLILIDVLLPAALPHVLSGARVGLGTAWMSVIAAELVGAQSGLGFVIQLHRVLLRTDRVIAGMATIGLIGFAMNWTATRLEQRLIPWRR